MAGFPFWVWFKHRVKKVGGKYTMQDDATDNQFILPNRIYFRPCGEVSHWYVSLETFNSYLPFEWNQHLT